jgi:hypothetical protein
MDQKSFENSAAIIRREGTRRPQERPCRAPSARSRPYPVVAFDRRARGSRSHSQPPPQPHTLLLTHAEPLVGALQAFFDGDNGCFRRPNRCAAKTKGRPVRPPFPLNLHHASSTPTISCVRGLTTMI